MDRLLQIAQACPVSKILEGETKIRSYIYHPEDAEKKLQYSNEEITVVWKPEFCRHSARCVTQLPTVFHQQSKPWITMNGAGTAAIINQVNKCPTGALSFFYNKDREEV